MNSFKEQFRLSLHKLLTSIEYSADIHSEQNEELKHRLHASGLDVKLIYIFIHN